MILGLINVLLLRLNVVQETSCIACPRCRSEAVLIKVSVGFLCCHLSCYLLARRIMFLSRVMRSTGSAFAGAEGRLFLWRKAAKRPITHSPYLFTRPHAHTVANECELKERKTGLRINLIHIFYFLAKHHARARVAPKLRNFGYLSIPEILVVTWLFFRTTGKPTWNVTLSSLCGKPQPEISHPGCGQLTAVKTGYPLTSITWPYCGSGVDLSRCEFFFKCSADKLLVFIRLFTDPLFSLQTPSRTGNKTKPQGIYWPPAQGGSGGGRRK